MVFFYIVSFTTYFFRGRVIGFFYFANLATLPHALGKKKWENSCRVEFVSPKNAKRPSGVRSPD